MTEDQLLASLGKAERDDTAIPERWLRLVEGRATPAEVAALEEEAKAGGEAALLWERFRPLDRDAEHELARTLADKVREKKRARRIYATAGALAIAASLLFAFLAIPSTLPAYRLESAAADVEHRGSARETIAEHHVGSALSLILRPESRIQIELAADTYVIRNGVAEVWRAPLEISKTGAVRVDGKISELLPGVIGEVTLLFVLRPTDEDALAPDRALAAWRRGDDRRVIVAHTIRVRNE